MDCAEKYIREYKLQKQQAMALELITKHDMTRESEEYRHTLVIKFAGNEIEFPKQVAKQLPTEINRAYGESSHDNSGLHLQNVRARFPEISEKFKTWWRKYDDVEKCRLIKEKAMEVNNNHKKMVKASDAEFKYTGCRTGVRGGKATTLAANSQTATEFYLRSSDELKYMVATF